MDGMLVFSLLVLATGEPSATAKERGVAPIALSEEQRIAEGFSAEDSRGLFVGVRDFVAADGEPSNIAEVAYAVDDAVDLAHLFALELRLIAPANVTLALSGEPQKRESRERLKALLRAGAQERAATYTSLVDVVFGVSAQAGKRGVLVVSFATHGFSQRGADRLLARDSSLTAMARTAIPVNDVIENASRSEAPRRLVLLDACRERLSRDTRAIDGSAMSESFANAIREAQGMAVLSGSILGGFSYDDRELRNGVFTSSIVAGLRGGAPADERGFITPASLASFVDDQVRSWVRKKRPEHKDISTGIQYTFDGAAGRIPLAVSLRTALPAPAPAAPAAAGTPPKSEQVAGHPAVVAAVPPGEGLEPEGVGAGAASDAAARPVLSIASGAGTAVAPAPLPVPPIAVEGGRSGSTWERWLPVGAAAAAVGFGTYGIVQYRKSRALDRDARGMVNADRTLNTDADVYNRTIADARSTHDASVRAGIAAGVSVAVTAGLMYLSYRDTRDVGPFGF